MRTIRITDSQLLRLARALHLGEERDGARWLNQGEAIQLEWERRRVVRMQAQPSAQEEG